MRGARGLIGLSLLCVCCAFTSNVLYFSDEQGVGWCDLRQLDSVSDCNPSNSYYQSWVHMYSHSITLVNDPQGNAYVINSTKQGSLSIWRIMLAPSGHGLLVKEVATILNDNAGKGFTLAHWISNPTGPGSLLLGMNPLIHTKNTTYVVLNTDNWEPVATFQERASFGSFKGGEALYMGKAFVASLLSHRGNVNATVVVRDLASGNSTTLFVCNGSMGFGCEVHSFVVIGEVLYFSSGWQLWSISLQNPTGYTEVANLFEQSSVNGVYGAAWADENGVYWYFDAAGNTNYIQYGIATQGTNQLSTICTITTITSAILSIA